VTDPRFNQDFLSVLNARSQDIFKRLVERFIETGEPVGSRQLSRALDISLSPATVRNVMADLEDLGLIAAPHTSAGRAPTQLGLRFFVDAMLEVGAVGQEERRNIEKHIDASDHSGKIEDVLAQASQVLSGLSHGAGLVLAPKADIVLKHIEFVRLDAQMAMAVLVGEDGHVENRVFKIPAGLTASELSKASNFLSHQVAGRTLRELRAHLQVQKTEQQAELDDLTQRLVDEGLATLTKPSDNDSPTLIVRGRANLIDDAMAREDLDRVRQLFDELENKKSLIDLLQDTQDADGVRIFIGSENKLFSLSGSSVILSPYRDAQQKVVGIVGVIGPTRLNYARIVPAVDYTAHIVSKLINKHRP
jgi:heat-inducible transcriptional repressor